MNVVHVVLEVLDDAALIGTEDPRTGLAVEQCADRMVMCLKDRLEVEREAVPEGELARLRAGQQAASLGSPLCARE